MKKLTKSLMSLKTKTQLFINNNIRYIDSADSGYLDEKDFKVNKGGHRPLYPFFGKSQAWMKII